MKKLLLGFSLILAIFLGVSLNSEKANAVDTVVVGQPYYGYGGYYGGGFYPYGGGYGRGYGGYGVPFVPGVGYNSNNPVFQAGAVGSNPYFLTGMQRRAGAISSGQRREALQQTNTIIGAGIVANPNEFNGPYVNYYGDGAYAY